MSLITSENYSPVALPGSFELPRKRWTRSQYRQFVSLGMIEEGAPYELIEGEVVLNLGQKRDHVIASMLVFRLMMRTFPEGQVQSQSPIAADDYNEPEPDIAVLRNDITAYREDAPGPADILLLVEVSNTTLQFDRGVKAAIYARTGIPEYWVLDVNGRTLDVYRQPAPSGYGSVTGLTSADSVSPLSAPDASLTVAGFLPPIAAGDDD